MTDGCAAQYKSRYPFADAANAVNDFNFVLQRDYYGSRHGKSRCDGEGGVLKSRVTRAVRNNEAVIDDAESFFKFCQEKMQKQQASNEKCEHKRRHMFYVDTTEVRRPRPERNIQTVNGTQKIHSLMGVSPTLIKTRRLSCFCDGCLEERSNECDNREYVDTWKTVHLKYVQSGQCKESVADNTDTPVSDENGLDKNDGISHSLESTITDTDKMSRGGYFRKLLVSLLGCTSFKDLSVICESEDIFLKDMFPLHIKHEQRTILSVKKEIDQMAFDLMPADIQYDHPIFPVKVFGDGNCLPRTGSLFAFGDEESHEEIRARIVVQSVKYAEKYLDSTILSAGTEEEHCLPKIYAQYSDFYIPGISLTDDIVRKVFENEILAICKRGSFMGIWQLHALADVLQCTIHSVHPQYGGYNTRKHLNRTILPSCEGNRGMDLHIMWSNVNGKDTKEVLWAPNHFVPLLPVDKIPSALEVETADEGDDSTLNSFSFTSNFSFDESIFNLVVDDEDAAPLVNWKEDNVVTPVAVDKAVPLTPSLDRRENDVTEIGAPTVVDLDLPLAPRSKQKKDNLTVVGVPDVDMGVAFVPRGDKKKNDLSVISAPTDVETDVHVDQKNLAVVGTPQDVKMIVPLAPCGDQKKHDLPVSGIPTNIDIEVPAVSSRDQTKDELLVVCPPDEPSTISQRVFEKGIYLKVHFGTKSLPAIVDEWPWVKFFKKGNNKWVMNDIKYTIEADEVEKAIKAPQQIGRGRRTYFMFTDMDVPVEPLCDGRKDDLPVATTDVNMDIPVEPLCDGKKDDLPVAATDVNMDITVEPLSDGKKDDLPVATTDVNMDIPVEPLCDGKKDDLPVAATDVNMDITVEPLSDGKKDDLPATDVNMDIPVEPLCDGKKDDLPVAATDVNMDIPVEPLCDGKKDDLPVAATDVNMDIPVEPLCDGKKDDLPVAATDVNMDIPVEPLCDGKKDDLPVAATDINMDVPVELLCDGKIDDLPVAATDVNMDVPAASSADQKKYDLPLVGVPTDVDVMDASVSHSIDVPVSPCKEKMNDDLAVVGAPPNVEIDVRFGPSSDQKNDDLPVAVLKTDQKIDKLPVVCPPGVSSCPPDEPSTAPQRAFEKGQYIKVHFGSKSLPAIVDEWPWVNFFKKDNNKWVMNDIKYTIEADEVEKVIKAPQQIGRGRRTYFKFAEMDC